MNRDLEPDALRQRGTYEWLAGDHAPAERWWQRSIDRSEALGTWYALGATHLEFGQRTGKRDHLERAEELFAGMGAEFDLARARDSLAAR